MNADAPSPPALVVRVPAGAARRVFYVNRPAGVVLLTEMIVPRGAQVRAAAEIPGLAGVGVSTRGIAPDACRTDGTTTVCTRGQEWCPMPSARWRITFVKRSGPAGLVRMVFRIGPISSPAAPHGTAGE
jgi:hypothetical protein